MEANKLKLLAIDDNRDNLTSLKAVVTDRLPGAALLTAMNGARGLELAMAEDPDVILLDIVMPGMDGYAVCRKLKQDERLQSIPVIFLTALKTDQESRIRALDAGAEGFLSKPFDEAELIAQVRAMAKIKAANQYKRLEIEQLEALVAERTRELEQELAERKQAENALRISEERYRNLLVNLETGIVVHSPDTSIFMSNNRASELLGISIDQMKGKAAIDPAWKFVSEANTPLPLDEYPVNRIVSGKQPIKNHVLGIRQPGKNDIVWVTVNGFPVLDNSGETTEIVISFIDITERKQAEAALQEKHDELTRFNYSVSHDLRSPLVTIKTFLGYLEQDMAKADTKNVARDLGLIHTAADKMNALLEELLDLSRIGRVVNPPVEAPLQKIATDALGGVNK
ncbi:MAG: response regulator [Verrucomicrobia bacterium]|nr:response regulator [Verrucomicrobiota bacterium]